MDSQSLRDVVHVDRRAAWTDVVFASLRARDCHVSDDDIFEILTAAEDGGSVSDLCEARGVTFPMYCVWKAKYRHLTLDELRTARRRELWRARAARGALVAAGVLAIAAIVYGVGLGRAADEPTPRQVDRAPSVVSPTPTPSAEVGVAPAATPLAAAVSAPAAPKPIDRVAPSATLPPVTQPGYHIQIAAAPTLQEAEALLARLVAAGHRAYLSSVLVNEVEVFRVRVGPFETLPAAAEVAGQLRSDGFTDAWIALTSAGAR